MYNEFDRPDFPVKEREFLAGVFREMSKAAELKSKQQEKDNFAYVCADINVRLGNVQEGAEGVTERSGGRDMESEFQPNLGLY